METANKASGIHGNKLYQKRARQALPILVRLAQAKPGQKITYSDLAEELGMPNRRNLNYPLGSIGTELKGLGESWGEVIPPIQCLVVNKDTMLPGEGISNFISDKSEYKNLNTDNKDALVDEVLKKVFSYPKWQDVLEELALQPVAALKNVSKNVQKAALPKRGGSGESKEHKKLKEYIRNHPEKVGIKKGRQAEIEKPLPSGDSIDVTFEDRKRLIGVEVKSKKSGDGDILRGLFQCVKYQAVLEAWLSVKGQQKDVKMILALGGKFPKRLIPVRNTLGINVKDKIKTS